MVFRCARAQIQEGGNSVIGDTLEVVIRVSGLRYKVSSVGSIMASMLL